MQTTQYLAEILKELNHSADLIADEEAEKLVNGILESKKVFVAGAGRSGFMAKSFAMRMMHMGIDSYVIGETVTPNFEKEDILIIGSGSGETKSLVSMAEKAKSIGGKIATVTIFPDSTIGQLADVTIKLPGSPKDQSKGDYKTIQPMGSLFEQTLLLFYDAVILRFMEKKGLDTNKMYGKHANLE
ncbi:6-phospho-3-hexuloisomerase (plasmid) [Priestia megaterium]|uniref:3-hexulose-6-phosphate isomerase n=1 Tax=Priestia megaterium (strain ATCC 14581 / DSM 32 / CCUG 1817 / JCM 2506 / NBRC 15308 / NCIMB 9376 / NCTC 10342 / NRRL B-14308 / VKM B-512 / Ford 19) TaxID=1348623 RepID=A0A0B6B0P9_PRIM2|nr:MULTISPECIES: 6-phospho-3-hexuloisomerase [Priestia]NHH96004.1 3-hexulose-6-phosphate isomerase [Bacillus sp. MB95]AJI25749.1 3-hexulose-6-phosphate isomerase [Priestia megaterium NBRC 15308 = ATCC 14581]KFN07584.1 3-hexulose-6-phosphate isomerase [Priestia megaterium]KGJ79908.1 6-phospho 3-hexuloisomerase [Priestia megaterium NBRC 15308 = ATCC 14581]KLV29183.1 6-phospho 3-hexuloisomerase [Priestia megaterium]